jgi:hypothetical protein
MPTWVWLVIALVAIVVIAGAVWQALAAKRTKRLQERFGPEYDRAAQSVGSKRQAEAELSAREERREQLNIRPLPAEARQRYAGRWDLVQTQFVDAPTVAVSAADSLVGEVMADRGYPMDDFDQRAADISVDHPHVVENYRDAKAISRSARRGQASTEDLRQAMQNYRALFDELLGDNAADRSLGRDGNAAEYTDSRTSNREAVR